MEDTDVKRSRDELVRPMLEAFRWLGLDWDEGPEVGGPYGPYFQSQRLDLYAAHAERLLRTGHAYRCYCTPEELEQRRKEALARGLPPRYDRRCRDLTPAQEEALVREGRRPVLRLKMPLEGVTVVRDLVRGDVAFEHAVLDDWVLVKSDGMPTYNFACVVDDATMEITHVIRAEEHLSNTPKQVLLYRALGYELPQFAHVPMILAPDRSKLSKRHGATAVHEYRERGYLPDALVNYLATLGWYPEGGQEIISRDEMIRQFSLERVSKSAAIYDNEKLTWMNAQYLRLASAAQLVDWALPFWRGAGLLPVHPPAANVPPGAAPPSPEAAAESQDASPPSPEAAAGPRDAAPPPPDPATRRWLEGIMEVMRERVRTLAEVPEATRYFFTADFNYDEKGVARHFARPEVAGLLQTAVERLRALPDWDAAAVEHCYRSLAEERGIGAGQIIHPTRLALTGRTVGPGLFDIMALLGREETLRRLERAISWIRSR